MRIRPLLILLLLCAGCQNAAPLLAPGGFEAASPKTTSSGPGSGPVADDDGDGGDDADPPPDGSAPPSRKLADKIAQGGSDRAGSDKGGSDDGASGGNFMMRDRNLLAGNGPIGPKVDNEDTQMWVSHYRLRYGPEYADILAVSFESPSQLVSDEDGTINLRFLLEERVWKRIGEDGKAEYEWRTQQPGPQMRLIYIPNGNQIPKYADAAVTAVTPEGYNVAFNGVRAGLGKFWIYILNRKPPEETGPFNVVGPDGYYRTDDFHAGEPIPFPDENAYQTRFEGQYFYFTGAFRLERPKTNMIQLPPPPDKRLMMRAPVR